MLHDTTTLHGIDRPALLRVVEPIVRAHGAELVDLEFKPDRGGWVLRLYVEKEGALAGRLSTRDAAVDLELCAGISRDLSPALDVADLIAHAYHLEVGSPGVERPLRREGDFDRFAGEKIKIKLHRDAAPTTAPSVPPDGTVAAASEGRPIRVVIGTLKGMVDGKVRVEEGGRTHDVPLASIESARLVFEFGPRGKPNGKPRGRDTQQRKH
jgi:ribosome maturation factor RimP